MLKRANSSISIDDDDRSVGSSSSQNLNPNRMDESNMELGTIGAAGLNDTTATTTTNHNEDDDDDDDKYKNRKHKHASKASFHKIQEYLSTMIQIAKQIPKRTKPYRRHIVVLGTFLFLSYRANQQNHVYYNKSPISITNNNNNHHHNSQSQMQLHIRKHEEYTKKYPDRREHPLVKQHKQESSNQRIHNHNLPNFLDPYRGDDGRVSSSLHPLLIPDLSEKDAMLHLFPNPSIPIPPILGDSMATLDEPFREGDIPVFFHVPRSGGTSIKKIMEVCLNMKLMDTSPASIASISSTMMNGKTQDGTERNQTSFDTNNEQPLIDVLSVQDPYILPTIFQTLTTHNDDNHHPDTHPPNDHQQQQQQQQQQHRGRVFIMLRHPMDRILSSFYYYGKAHWEPNHDPELAHISLELYAKQNRTEHNYLVRTLTNIPFPHPLSRNELHLAKEVLRTKCLIGLLSEKDHSMNRFQTYFQWDYSSERTKKCHERFWHWDFVMKNPHPMIQEGSEAWNRILEKNELDMELYEYAKELFRYQQVDLFHYHEEGHVIGRKGHL